MNEDYVGIFKGTVSVDQNEGEYMPVRLTEKQFCRYKRIPRCVFPYASAGIKMEFVTDTEEISFSYLYTAAWTHFEGNIPTFDIYVNGVLKNILPIETDRKNQWINLSVKLCKENERNKITVYFPHNAAIKIKNISIGDFGTSDPKKRRLLVMGDSISQGLMGNTSSLTYAEIYARFFDMEILNQSVGGDCFDEEAIDENINYEPTDVIVALGTNDVAFYNDYDLIEVNAKKYLEKIHTLYNNCDVTVVTPPGQLSWDKTDKNRAEMLKRIREFISGECVKHGFYVLRGHELLPENQRFYIDDTHPNDLGFSQYAVNLIKAKLSRLT